MEHTAIDGILYNDYCMITNTFESTMKGISVKWINDQKIRMQLMIGVSYDDDGNLQGNYLYPTSIEFKEKKTATVYRALFPYTMPLYSFNTVSYQNFIELPSGIIVKSINIEDYKKVHKTPWYIGNTTSLPRQLVLVSEKGEKYKMGCIDISYIPNIKLSSDLFDAWWAITHPVGGVPNLSIASLSPERKSDSKDAIEDVVVYFKQHSRSILNIILDYCVTEEILLTGIEGEMLKPFMDKNHFKLNEKRVPTMAFVGAINVTPSLVITEYIMSWIIGNCTHHILKLIPILISYGFVAECSKAISRSIMESKENCTTQIFVNFGAHMSFTKTNVTESFQPPRHRIFMSSSSTP